MVAATLVATALVAAGAGCSDGGGGSVDATVATPGPLTDEQASRLANVLFDNLDAKGATFQVEARNADGSTLSLTGEIDWVGHRGHAVVRATGVEAGLAEVYWSEDEVLERWPELNALVRDAENLDIDYVTRPPTASRPIDRLLAIVTALAGEQRDNPLLIKQAEGSAFVRTDELRGVAVEVLRFGTSNTYWLDTSTGAMLRLEDPGIDTGQPLVVDIIERGPQQIDGPPADSVAGVDELGELYPFPVP